MLDKKSLIKQNCKIILASSSIARKKILSNLSIKFDVIKPNFNEELAKPKIKNLNISDQALYLACQKALSVSIYYPDCLVIGSDQICQLKNKAIDKSKNYEEAINQLKILQGKTHIQNNATCIYQGNKLLFSNVTKAKLTLRNLTDEEIVNYVKFEKSWNCAGSYKYESMAKHLFSKVEGTDNSIIGMDILPLISFLHQNKFIYL